MRSILAERNPPDDQDDMEEVEYKPFTEADIGVNDLPVAKVSKYKTLTLEETQALLAKSYAPVVEPPYKEVTRYHETYSREQVEQWVKEYFIDKEKIDGFQRRRQNKGEEPSN